MHYRWYNDKKRKGSAQAPAPPATSSAKGRGAKSKKSSRVVLTDMVNHSAQEVSSSTLSGSEPSGSVMKMSEAELEVASILVGSKYRTPV